MKKDLLLSLSAVAILSISGFGYMSNDNINNNQMGMNQQGMMGNGASNYNMMNQNMMNNNGMYGYGMANQNNMMGNMYGYGMMGNGMMNHMMGNGMMSGYGMMGNGMMNHMMGNGMMSGYGMMGNGIMGNNMMSGCGMMGYGTMNHHNMMGSSMILPQIMMLNLSNEQIEKIENILYSGNNNFTEPLNAFTESGFDKNSYIKAIEKNREMMLSIHAEKISKIYSILTSEQKKNLKSIIDAQKVMRNQGMNSMMYNMHR